MYILIIYVSVRVLEEYVEEQRELFQQSSSYGASKHTDQQMVMVLEQHKRNNATLQTTLATTNANNVVLNKQVADLTAAAAKHR